MPSRVRIDGDHLEYRAIAPASPPATTIVFLHDGLGSIALWRDFPDAVCRRTGCGGLLYSRLGHGGSDPERGPRTPRFLHDEALLTLPRVLERFGVVRPVLVGHSDGASIALIAAGAGPVAPRALVLEAPHVFVEDVTVDGLGRICDGYHRGDLRERLRRHHGDNADALFATWTAAWLAPGFRSWNIEQYAQQADCPTLVIQGHEDGYGTRRQVDAIADAMGARCAVLMLDDCGHTPHVEQRAAVEQAAVGFIGSCLREPGGSAG